METKNDQEPFCQDKNDEKIFKCGICESTFHIEKLLANHLKKAHFFNICEKSFSDRNLARHKTDVHGLDHPKTNEEKLNSKSLQCDVCENIFSSHQSLLLHKASIHEITMPYKCEKCEKSFASLGTLREESR